MGTPSSYNVLAVGARSAERPASAARGVRPPFYISRLIVLYLRVFIVDGSREWPKANTLVQMLRSGVIFSCVNVHGLNAVLLQALQSVGQQLPAYTLPLVSFKYLYFGDMSISAHAGIKPRLLTYKRVKKPSILPFHFGYD
jgi:hypothetical protein